MRVFIKHGEKDGRNLILDVLDWVGTLEDFLTALRSAVSEWLDEQSQDLGRDDFTMLSLLEYVPHCFLEETTLGGHFNNHGIKYFHFEVIEADWEADMFRADMRLYIKEDAEDKGEQL